MSKLKIQDLKVESFVTGNQDQIKGGATFRCTAPTFDYLTCQAACGPTDGVHICKEV